MGENILIASLGESPVVVTAMFDLLMTEEKQHELGEIKKVIVLRPTKDKEEEDDSTIAFGYTLIEEALEGQCELIPELLPFEDANSEWASFYFLQRLYQLLFFHQERGDTIFLSLAGGRKNMSALMALLAPFFPCVKKLYHVLDKDDNKRKHQFKSIAELINLSHTDQKLYMHPELDRLILVDIPYGEKQRISPELRASLFTITNEELDELWDKNPMQAQLAETYRQFAQTSPPESALTVELTLAVKKEYERMCKHDITRAKAFEICFAQMSNPVRLKSGLKGSFSRGLLSFYFYKRRRTAERPFFHTEPENIFLYPNAKVQRVIVSGLSIEKEERKSEDKYEPSAEELLQIPLEQLKQTVRVDILPRVKPVIGREVVSSSESILLIPLGISPMVATQLYTLLSREHPIREVVLIYPYRSQEVRNSAELVKDALNDEGIRYRDVPIKGLEDIKSTQDCLDYEKALEDIIGSVRKEHPECEIDLALSGGRKGMAALAMFVAQRKGIRYLYHTVINDDVLEKLITNQTSIKGLNEVSRAERRERLFLRTYADEGMDTSFALFRVPVVPAGSSDTA